MKANSMKTIGKRLTFLILIMCVAVSISAQSYQLSGNGVNSALSFLKVANSAIENKPAPLSSFQNSSATSYNVFLKSGPK